MTATEQSAETGPERARRRRLVMLALAAVGLAHGPPARADQLGDFIKGMGDQVTSRLPSSSKPPTTASPSSTGKAPAANSGAMGLQAGATLPPLHRLGTDAVAVVEAASANAPVRQMDYVFAKQTISLGPKGSLTMSYLSGCLTEVINGGVVTVAAAGSRVAGGKLQSRATPGCRAPKPVILASASEAGATVNRVTPFSNAKWDERSLKGGPPVFKWDKTLGVTTLRVKDMDKEGEPVAWEGPVTLDWAAYPAKGPRLAPGEPYRAEAMAGGKVVAAAYFSIDPALDVAENLANRVVPLSAP